MADDDPVLPATYQRGDLLRSGVAQITSALANVPADKRVVWVTTIDVHGVLRSGTMVRVGDHWGFGAEAQWDLPQRDLDGFAFVKVEF